MRLMSRKWTLFLSVFACFGAVNAGWWPFGSDDDSDEPRLSELMEPASLLIDDATDLAADGKYQDAVVKYREALGELSKVETDHPDRAATTEFASLRNKRAYVNAAIDTLLLAEARSNAKAVAITDTTELEKKFLRKKGLLAEEPAEGSVSNAVAAAARPTAAERRKKLQSIGESVRKGDYASARAGIDELLQTNASDAAALNLRAVCEASTGDFEAAGKTLELVIRVCPRDYNGYYNLANLKLQGGGDKVVARYYYERGRAVGGPEDAELEAAMEE